MHDYMGMLLAAQPPPRSGLGRKLHQLEKEWRKAFETGTDAMSSELRADPYKNIP
jgi:hypothetical protein